MCGTPACKDKTDETPCACPCACTKDQQVAACAPLPCKDENNKEMPHNSQWVANDGCSQCKCDNGVVRCTTETCQNPLKCIDLNGKTYDEGQQVPAADGSCTPCFCREGKIACGAFQPCGSAGDVCQDAMGGYHDVGTEWVENQCKKCRCAKTDAGVKVECDASQCPACTVAGEPPKHYPLGAIWPAGDQCNSCKCVEPDTIRCTQNNCGEQKPCVDAFGKEHASGTFWPKGDGCNNCTCSAGMITCSERRCPEPCKDRDGNVYPSGAQFPAGDGCNSCFCDNGVALCTDRACNGGKDCTTSDGKVFKDGASFPARDGCNTCTCTDGSIACTKRICANCTDAAGGNHTSGSVWPAPDCCNECTCRNGDVACTDRVCAPCVYKQVEHRSGETFKDDCNTCHCCNGKVACTERACQEPELCAGECPLSADAKCNDDVYINHGEGRCNDFGHCLVNVSSALTAGISSAALFVEPLVCADGCKRADGSLLQRGSPCACRCACNVDGRIKRCAIRGSTIPTNPTCPSELKCADGSTCAWKDGVPGTAFGGGCVCGATTTPCLRPCNLEGLVCPGEHNVGQKCYALEQRCQCRDTKTNAFIACEAPTGSTGGGVSVGEQCPTNVQCPVNRALPCKTLKVEATGEQFCACFPQGEAFPSTAVHCEAPLTPCDATSKCKDGRQCVRHKFPGTDEERCVCFDDANNVYECPAAPVLRPCDGECPRPASANEFAKACMHNSSSAAGSCKCQHVDKAGNVLRTLDCTGGSGGTVTDCPLAYCPDNDALTAGAANDFQGCVYNADKDACYCRRSGNLCRGVNEIPKCGDDIVCPEQVYDEKTATSVRPECRYDGNRCFCEVAGGRQRECVPRVLNDCDERLVCPLNLVQGSTLAPRRCDRSWRVALNVSATDALTTASLAAVDTVVRGVCNKTEKHGTFCALPNGVVCKTRACDAPEALAVRTPCTCGCACQGVGSVIHECVKDPSATPTPAPPAGDVCDTALLCDARFDDPIQFGAAGDNERCRRHSAKGICRNHRCMLPLQTPPIVCESRRPDAECLRDDSDGKECECKCACFGYRSTNSATDPTLQDPTKPAEAVLHAVECVKSEPPSTPCDPFLPTTQAQPCDERQRVCPNNADKPCRPTKKGMCRAGGLFCVIDGCALCKAERQCNGTMEGERRECSCGCACPNSAPTTLLTPNGETRRVPTLDRCGANTGEERKCETEKDCKDGERCYNNHCVPRDLNVVVQPGGEVAVHGRRSELVFSLKRIQELLGDDNNVLAWDSTLLQAKTRDERVSAFRALMKNLRDLIGKLLPNLPEEKLLDVVGFRINSICAYSSAQLIRRSFSAAYSDAAEGDEKDALVALNPEKSATMTTVMDMQMDGSRDVVINDTIAKCSEVLADVSGWFSCANVNISSAGDKLGEVPCGVSDAKADNMVRRRHAHKRVQATQGSEAVSIDVVTAAEEGEDACTELKPADGGELVVTATTVASDKDSSCLLTTAETEYVQGSIRALQDEGTQPTNTETTDGGDGNMLLYIGVAAAAVVVVIAIIACACFMSGKGKKASNERRRPASSSASAVPASVRNAHLQRSSSGRTASRTHMRVSSMRRAAAPSIGGSLRASHPTAGTQVSLATQAEYMRAQNGTEMNTMNLTDANVNPLSSGSLKRAQY